MSRDSRDSTGSPMSSVTVDNSIHITLRNHASLIRPLHIHHHLPFKQTQAVNKLKTTFSTGIIAYPPFQHWLQIYPIITDIPETSKNTTYSAIACVTSKVVMAWTLQVSLLYLRYIDNWIPMSRNSPEYRMSWRIAVNAVVWSWFLGGALIIACFGRRLSTWSLWDMFWQLVRVMAVTFLSIRARDRVHVGRLVRMGPVATIIMSALTTLNYGIQNVH